jgi:hypothetical protein
MVSGSTLPAHVRRTLERVSAEVSSSRSAAITFDYYGGPLAIERTVFHGRMVLFHAEAGRTP